MSKISVIIPAYNEEKYIRETLDCVNRAKTYAQESGVELIEVIVVDNDSTDETATIAKTLGATVVHESIHNIAKVRNDGVRASTGDILVFLDADTIIPDTLLWRIHKILSDDTYVGGAVDTDYRPARSIVKIYLQFWRVVAKIARMVQGAAQFCRRESYVSAGGYDETFYMGEDVEFYWRLQRVARKQDRKLFYIEDIKVIPSCRRFDRWPFWRTLIWTNPLFILFFRRWEKAWDGWHSNITR